MSSLVKCTLIPFHYRNGRQGFLAQFPDGRQLAVTNNLDGVPEQYLIFRTYGESEKLANDLYRAFLDGDKYERAGLNKNVGYNNVKILKLKEDGKTRD